MREREFASLLADTNSMHGAPHLHQHCRENNVWPPRAEHISGKGSKKFSWPSVSPARKPVERYECGEDGEDNPFLVPPVPPKDGLVRTTRTTRTARTARTTRTTRAMRTTRTNTDTSNKFSTRSLPISPAYSDSPDPLSLVDLGDNRDRDRDSRDAEEEEAVPYASLRHTSIRRAILERLKFGTLRRPETSEVSKVERESRSGSKSVRTGGGGGSFRRMGYKHRRKESDLCVDDVRKPERSYEGGEAEKRGREREGAVSTAGDGEFGLGGDETVWVPGSGFRIVEERLEAIREQIRTGEWMDEDGGPVGVGGGTAQSSPSVWSATPVIGRGGSGGESGGYGDKYTPMPVRKSPSKTKSNAGLPILRKESTDTIFWNGLSRVDSTVLPLSPPQILSPPLESRLMFTPMLPPQSRSRSASVRGRGGRTQGQGQGIAMAGTRGSVPSASSDRTNRLIKTQTRGKVDGLPPTPPRRMNLPSAATSRARRNEGTGNGRGKHGTPKERYEARRGALTKVEEILAQSWSERDVRVSSPTMFGAVVSSGSLGELGR